MTASTRLNTFKYTSIILVLLFVSGFLILFLLPVKPLLEGTGFSRAIYDDKHQLLRLTLSSDDKYRLYTPLSKIPIQLVDATLLQEDQYFRQHSGVNPVSMLKAAWQTYAVKSRKVGASTITMQVARLRYGIYTRTMPGKLMQIIRAWQFEMHYSKEQILEAYLNLAPYGGNVEGVGAASLVYFNKPVDMLSLPDVMTLAVIPQNPEKRSSRPGATDPRDHLFARWLNKHPEDQDKKGLFSLPLVMQSRQNLPFLAPHFVSSVLRDSSTQEPMETTLSLRTQRLVERKTRQYLAGKNKLGVNNAAVLLVDTRDMGIKALIGSADFFNQRISGQINGTETRRSPGSTLKPFIYGLAIDQGLIHPSTMLKDVPRSFNGYNPENFDYDFMGPIKARDALVLSRNIPAIELASQLSSPTLHQLLEQANVGHLKPESYYGLSLSLGGAEVTMKELAGLYAMLVNDGVWYPLRDLQDEGKRDGRRLLSAEASFLVLEMLKNTPGKHATSQLPVAWKTGTSSGYRDAWTAGSFGPYVLVVWVGNFDNTSNPAFVGKDIAAPLFFALIDAIRHEYGTIPSMEKNPLSMHLEKVEVCKASGMLPTRYCKDTEPTWFIPGKSPIKTDTIYREVAINGKTGLRTCHIDQNTRFEVFEFWPSDVLKIFKRAGIQRHSPPFFEPDCALSGNGGMSPNITSPQTGVSYIAHTSSGNNSQIPFTAVTEAGVEYVYWFLNEAFVARTKAGTAYLWQAKPGTFVVRAVDDHGLADARDFVVKMYS